MGQNFADGSINEDWQKNFRRCWLTVQNENTIMPNSQILFLRMLGKLQNRENFVLQKFPAIRYLLYCLLHVVCNVSDCAHTHMAGSL